MSMPSPAVNVFNMKKAPVCVNIFACNGFSRCQSFCARYCCHLHLFAWSHLRAASVLVPHLCFKDKPCKADTSRQASKGGQDGSLSYMTHELSFIVIIHRHPSTSFSIIHRPSSTSFIIIHRHSSTSSIIIHLTLSCYLLLPNSFPLSPPAFLSGHTVV